MTNKTDINKKIFLQAFEKTMGNVSHACKNASIARASYYEWYNEDPEFKAAVEGIKESLIDLAESALTKQIAEGNTTAIIFFLKTQGKKRGYSEHVEITGKDGAPLIPAFPTEVQINVVRPSTVYTVDDKSNTA